MQLKIRRSQRDGGIISKTAIFCLDAMAQLTPEEAANVRRYKLASLTIYSSEASRRALEKSDMRIAKGTTSSYLASFISTAIAAMNLNITIGSLQQGHHIECKSLDELLGAEDALMTACENLKSYLDAAATFDGREVLFDFETGKPQIVASASQPALIAPTITPLPATPAIAATTSSLPPPMPEPLQTASVYDTPAASGSEVAAGGLDPTKLILWGSAAAVVVVLLVFILF